MATLPEVYAWRVILEWLRRPVPFPADHLGQNYAVLSDITVTLFGKEWRDALSSCYGVGVFIAAGKRLAADATERRVQAIRLLETWLEEEDEA